VAFSPDGKTLATAASRIEGDLLHVGWQLVGGVELWDVATSKERAFLKGHQDGVSYLVFSADGSKLATADHFEVKLWDTATGTQRASLKDVLAPLTFSKDGKRLATLLPDGSVKWNDVEKLAHSTLRK
jgi:WD40 repeat protein